MDILVASFLRAQNIIHVEDIVAVFVIVAIVFYALAWLGEDTAGIARRLVFELGVTYTISGREMRRQRLERLKIKPLEHSVKDA